MVTSFRGHGDAISFVGATGSFVYVQRANNGLANFAPNPRQGQSLVVRR